MPIFVNPYDYSCINRGDQRVFFFQFEIITNVLAEIHKISDT